VSGSPQSTQDVSAAERKLLQLMSDIGFGRLEQLGVVGGRPDLHGLRVVRDIKLGGQGDDVPRPSGDFALKQEVRDFFAVLRGLDSAVIRKIEIRHGLPVHLQIEEAADGGGR